MNKVYVIKIIDLRGKAWFYTRYYSRALIRHPIQTLHYGTSVSFLSGAKLYDDKENALKRARKVKKICEDNYYVTVVEIGEI